MMPIIAEGSVAILMHPKRQIVFPIDGGSAD